ncbi:hypothetical protein ACKFKF_29775 [Phormidesmis sp. 146-12]
MRFFTYISALLASAALALPAAAIEFYKDAKDNLYFEGLNPQDLVSVTYLADTQPKRLWMYRDITKTCLVHNLYKSNKRLLFSGSIRLYLSPLPSDFQPSDIAYAPQNSNPCNGGTIDSSLPWTTIAPGIQAIRLLESNRFGRCPYDGCLPSEKIPITITSLYLSGLAAPAYQVSDLRDRVRFSAADSCGFLKLANTTKWSAFRADRLEIRSKLKGGPNYGIFARAGARAARLRPDNQISRCKDGTIYRAIP